MAQNTVFRELAELVTENRNPNTYDIDIMSTEQIVRLINKLLPRPLKMAED